MRPQTTPVCVEKVVNFTVYEYERWKKKNPLLLYELKYQFH